MAAKSNKNFNKPIDTIKIEDIYCIINHVQSNYEECSFETDEINAITIENILKDINLKYQKSLNKKKVKFTLIPPEKKEFPDDLFNFGSDDEELDDEIKEDGQCF